MWMMMMRLGKMRRWRIRSLGRRRDFCDGEGAMGKNVARHRITAVDCFALWYCRAATLLCFSYPNASEGGEASARRSIDLPFWIREPQKGGMRICCKRKGVEE